MKLVFCTHCHFVYIDPAGSPGHDGRPVKLEVCPQCFGNGGGKLLLVPADVIAKLAADGFKDTAANIRPYTPRTFPIATTPPEPKTEDECRPQ